MPHVELTGSIAASVAQLIPLLQPRSINEVAVRKELREARESVTKAVMAHAKDTRTPIHPLRCARACARLVGPRFHAPSASMRNA